MAGSNFLAGESSIWVQPDGPNTEPKYLGCHSVGDIPEPKGDSTTLYCPDPARSGKFVAKNVFKGEPGTITTTIETDLRKSPDPLEDLAEYGCPFPFYVHKVSCGRRDVFTNFDRSFALSGVEITQRTRGNLVSRDPGSEGESTQSFDVSVKAVLDVFNLQASRISVAESENILSLVVAGEQACEGVCGQSARPEDYLLAATDALVGSASNTADVLRSIRGGAWLPTAADPFFGGVKISAITAIKLSRTVTRILVARGTTSGGNPAGIAYSDDNGATWTLVSVGTTNGEFVEFSGALFGTDRYNLWLGTNLGKIYFSSDAGETWSLKESGVISSNGVAGISFVDTQVGYVVYEDGDVGKTVDGNTWSATTVSGSSTATDVHAITEYFAWVSGSDGLYYTMDGGVTWGKRNSYNVAAIDFLNELFGIAVGGASSNAGIWMTFNGGYDWMALPAVSNSGFTDIKIVSPKLAFFSGKANGGTGFLGKINPA